MKMNTAKLITLGLLRGSGAAGITYLFRDEFTTDEAAPLTSPRTCEPGPGTLAFTDTASRFSISSDTLLTATSTTRAHAVSGSSYTRLAGRTLKFNFSAVAQTDTGIGFTSTATIQNGYNSAGFQASWRSNYVNGYVANAGSTVDLSTIAGSAATDPRAIVLQSTGALFYQNLGGTWALMWPGDLGALTPLWLQLTTDDKAGTSALDELALYDLAAPFDTDYGIATLNVASPTDATEYTGDANGIIDLTVTAPGSLDGSATTRCGFYYRADADLTPAWHCYVAGDGTFNLDSIASDGTRTNRITVAAVIAGAGVRTLRVIAAATVHNAYSLASTTWTKRGAAITLSLNDSVTRIIPSVPAGWSIANLRSYPRTSSAYDALDEV